MVEVKCIDLDEVVFLSKSVEMENNIFDTKSNDFVVSSVVRWQLLNRRNCSHSVKLMSEVNATTKKPYRQKGTGRARQGSLVSPQFRGGGVVFGPTKRKFAVKINKKVRKLALRVVLSDKFNSSNFFFMKYRADDSNISTSMILKKISKLFENFNKSKFLILHDDSISMFYKSVRNIKNIECLNVNGVNVYDLLRFDYILLIDDLFDSLYKRCC